jgi:SAM-dependent methyltransferase
MLPVPPSEFMFAATSGSDERVFLETGAADQAHVAAIIRKVLPESNNLRILDWGCGCGRIARHWESYKLTELYGCDVAERPVHWCMENLRFARFAVSGHEPPLPYPASFFDAMYGASVLTHLAFESQFRWMQEIWRVLKPGGVAVLTTHGPSLFPHILGSMRNKPTAATLIDEEIFLCVEEAPGSNDTGSLQTKGMTERIFSPFSLVEHRSRFGLMGTHDTNVLQKGPEGCLVVQHNVLSVPVSGRIFQASIEVNLGAARSLYMLATIDAALYPVQATFRVCARRAQVDLPMMLRWTGLAGAYVGIELNDLPQQVGTMKIEIELVSEHPMDGLRFDVPKLIAY